MGECLCYHCGSYYTWSWEEAFDKFGYNEGGIHTQDLIDVLEEAGYKAEAIVWGIHNEIITSIKLKEKELMPIDGDKFVVGYDDPRGYLPEEIVNLLDREC